MRFNSFAVEYDSINGLRSINHTSARALDFSRGKTYYTPICHPEISSSDTDIIQLTDTVQCTFKTIVATV